MDYGEVNFQTQTSTCAFYKKQQERKVCNLLWTRNNVDGMDVKGTLRSFGEMWYQIFLWCLATSVFIHCISACVAFLALRKHSRGVFFPLLVIFIGFLYPVTGGVVTSATIAAVYQTAHFTMPRYASFLWGAGQAFIGFLVSYTRVLATL